MSSYAVVQDGMVVNMIRWDGTADYTPAAGTLKLVDGDPPVGIGWTRVDDAWVAPPLPPDDSPTEEH